jgi:hypothetical protein
MPELSGKPRGEKMTGRESQEDNDLFFVCALLEYVARQTRNLRKDIVNALGRDAPSRIIWK